MAQTTATNYLRDLVRSARADQASAESAWLELDRAKTTANQVGVNTAASDQQKEMTLIQGFNSATQELDDLVEALGLVDDGEAEIQPTGDGDFDIVPRGGSRNLVFVVGAAAVAATMWAAALGLREWAGLRKAEITERINKEMLDAAQTGKLSRLTALQQAKKRINDPLNTVFSWAARAALGYLAFLAARKALNL